MIVLIIHTKSVPHHIPQLQILRPMELSQELPGQAQDNGKCLLATCFSTCSGRRTGMSLSIDTPLFYQQLGLRCHHSLVNCHPQRRLTLPAGHGKEAPEIPQDDEYPLHSQPTPPSTKTNARNPEIPCRISVPGSDSSVVWSPYFVCRCGSLSLLPQALCPWPAPARWWTRPRGTVLHVRPPLRLSSSVAHRVSRLCKGPLS